MVEALSLLLKAACTISFVAERDVEIRTSGWSRSVNTLGRPDPPFVSVQRIQRRSFLALEVLSQALRDLGRALMLSTNEYLWPWSTNLICSICLTLPLPKFYLAYFFHLFPSSKAPTRARFALRMVLIPLRLLWYGRGMPISSILSRKEAMNQRRASRSTRISPHLCGPTDLSY